MHHHKRVHITKASGKQMPFSEAHLRKSLGHCKAPKEVISGIVDKVAAEVYEGMPTEMIYEKVFNQLREHPNASAARYKLKKALMELGPTGYPFEKFIGRFFHSMGYITQTGQMLEGLCVRHEVDVVAQSGQEYIMIECKYHNQSGASCDVKVPLYISARFTDIRMRMKQRNDLHATKFQGWVATNVRFTNDAIQYGLCVGLRLIGWDYPKKEGLKDLIDSKGLYPITSLTTLTQPEKQELLTADIVLCSDIVKHKEALFRIIQVPERLDRVFSECNELSKSVQRLSRPF